MSDLRDTLAKLVGELETALRREREYHAQIRYEDRIEIIRLRSELTQALEMLLGLKRLFVEGTDDG